MIGSGVPELLIIKKMKKYFVLAVIGLMAAAANLSAQPQQGAGMPQMPPVLNPEEKTAQMAEKYKLTDEQKQAVLELNQKYDGKLEMKMPEQGEMKDFRKMTDAEREEFMKEMQSRMAEMQETQAQLEENQKAYENELKGILDKKQFRKYRSDVLRAQAEREQAMQRGFGGGFPGGGFPGGGMPGGGFPGGGFPGGGFPGGF